MLSDAISGTKEKFLPLTFCLSFPPLNLSPFVKGLQETRGVRFSVGRYTGVDKFFTSPVAPGNDPVPYPTPPHPAERTVSHQLAVGRIVLGNKGPVPHQVTLTLLEGGPLRPGPCEFFGTVGKLGRRGEEVGGVVTMVQGSFQKTQDREPKR